MPITRTGAAAALLLMLTRGVSTPAVAAQAGPSASDLSEQSGIRY